VVLCTKRWPPRHRRGAWPALHTGRGARRRAGRPPLRAHAPPSAVIDRARPAALILAAALLLGGAADALLRATPWGLNAALWSLLLPAAALILGWRRRQAAGERLLLLTAAGFALSLAWRDSPVLKALDLIAVGVTLSLTVLRRPLWDVRHASVTDYALAA